MYQVSFSGFGDNKGTFGTGNRYSSPSANQAIGQIGAVAAAQPGIFAGALGDAYGTYGNNLGSMFNTYGGALGNLGTAAANERGNLYGANAMMEAARMGALGNIGTAGLGAFGSASNAAQNAWAQNQNAYNQALSGMHGSNQSAVSQLGQSRNAALGQAAMAGAQVGSSSSRSGSNVNLNMGMGGMGSMGGGGMGFRAGSPSGNIASGSYGGMGGGFGGGFGFGGGSGGSSNSMSQSQMGDRGLIGSAMGGINDPSYLNAAQFNARDGLNRLDSQHYSSRAMPGEMLNATYGGLRGMMGDLFGQTSRAADQYYGNTNRAFDAGMNQTSGILRNLTSGYDSGRRDLGAGLSSTAGAMANYYNTGVMPLINQMTGGGMDPQARRQAATDLYNYERSRNRENRNSMPYSPSEDALRGMDRQLDYWRQSPQSPMSPAVTGFGNPYSGPSSYSPYGNMPYPVSQYYI